MTVTDVLVLFGGQSAEHDVSVVSASHVLAAIDKDQFSVSALGISKKGQWYEAAIDWTQDLPSLPETGPIVDPMAAIKAGTGDGAGVVIPVLHGPRGEDGTIQGLLELCNVAYVGSGVLGSSLSMDKAKSNEMLAAAGIPQAAFRSFDVGQFDDTAAKELVEDFGFPMFVKPANMGSSVGVSKVRSVDELLVAADLAFSYDTRMVVEEGIDGIEVEVGVLGNQELKVSVPGAIVPSADFYNYEDKYAAGTAELTVPAQITEAQTAEMTDLAKRTFRALDACGLARVDAFLRRSDGKILINEINTFPGFTPISMFPRLWQESGLSYVDLISEMIRLAKERHSSRATAAQNTQH